MDGTTAYESTHHLLLAMAGRIDDDLLGWARELVSVGEEPRAISLLIAEITASHTALPVAVRAALVDAGQAVRVDIDPATLAPAADHELPHRFAGAPAGAVTDVATAVQALPARHLQGCTVHLTWRLTPAGTAPGALPHPVVLVEIEPRGRALDVLAFQVAAGLDRVGVHASVEVLGVGQPRTAYHENALANARPVAVGRVQAPAAPTPVAAVAPAHREPAARQVPVGRPDQPQPAPAVRPEPIADTGATTARKPETTEAVEPEVVLDPNRPHPLAGGATPPPRPVEQRSAAPASVEAPAYRVPSSQVPERPPSGPPQASDAALSALHDPLSGPLNRPLLPPRFDPTIQPHDPLGVDHLVGPSTTRREPEPAADPGPAGARPRPPAAGTPTPRPDAGWAAEWESGAWAMPDDEAPVGSVRQPSEPVVEHRPRHEHREQRAPQRPPEPVRRPAEPAPPNPEHTPAAGGPESSARLSDTDRELLARLQAELSEGRRSRPNRRAGVSGPPHNGTNGAPHPEDGG